MKTRDEVIAWFRDKYAYLKALCHHQIGPFNASEIYQNPDGGWQLDLEQPGTDYQAAITLRPDDEVPHETHGVIGMLSCSRRTLVTNSHGSRTNIGPL